jgi:glycosyltransferase involved in cell wall biosynthesis
MKLSIIIPVYNEARTVGALLERVWSQPLPGFERELVVVESNSTDGSRELVQNFITQHPNTRSCSIHAIYESRPHGKGHAVRAGFAAASGTIFLIQDADLEYDTADYLKLLEPIASGAANFVLGSRHIGPNGWSIRKFSGERRYAFVMNIGGMVFHALFNVLFGTRLTDPTTMFKVFRADCLRDLSFVCDRFDFDFELVGKLVRRGFIPLEIAISYQSRGFAEGKKIRILRDPPTWIWAMLRARFGALDVKPDTAKKLPAFSINAYPIDRD